MPLTCQVNHSRVFASRVTRFVRYLICKETTHMLSYWHKVAENRETNLQTTVAQNNLK